MGINDSCMHEMRLFEQTCDCAYEKDSKDYGFHADVPRATEASHDSKDRKDSKEPQELQRGLYGHVTPRTARTPRTTDASHD